MRLAPFVVVLLLAGCLPPPPQTKTIAGTQDGQKTGPLPRPAPSPVKGVNTGEIPKPGALKRPDRKTTPSTPKPAPTLEPHPFDLTAPDEKTVEKKAITRFPGIRIYMEEKRVEIKGRINLNRCPTLEFLGCTPRGKTHETLLLFECEPKQLHLALIMLGLEPTPQVTEQGQPIALEKGEKVVIEVSWSTQVAPKADPTAPKPVDGRITRRVEDLIWDKVKRRSMPRVGWVFTGSRMLQVPAPPDYTKKMEVYAASYEGNLVATFHHPHVLLDTPLIEGGDDTVYIPFTQRIPERGTHVIIHVRPWKSTDGPAPKAPKTPEKKKAPTKTADPPKKPDTPEK